MFVILPSNKDTFPHYFQHSNTLMRYTQNIMPTNYTIVSNCKVILYTFRKVHYPVILYTKDYLKHTHMDTNIPI